MSLKDTVAVVVFNNIAPFEFAVACEVFGTDRSDMGLPGYDLLVCSAEPPPLVAKGGLFRMEAPYGLEALQRAGTVIVPAAAGHPERQPAGEQLLQALREAHDRGARIVSVCSGAFILAEAGLLDGRRATTHWMYAELLARRYPRVTVDPKVLYVHDGNVFTSAGTAAGIDLCLYLVRLDHGADVANMIARRMVVPPHRDGGQAQYVDLPMPQLDEDTALADTLHWAAAHLDEDLTVERLARLAHMSPRTFARRFLAAAGATPHQWLLSQRMLLAQRLLETTELPVEIVASRSGLGSAATLRQHFQRRLSTTPQGYRRTFQDRRSA